MSSADLALFVFTAVNIVRVIAFVPQVVCIARDAHGAEAISCTSWAMFAFAHLSTAVYAAITLGDAVMAWLFAANVAGCAAIIGLTVWKRRAPIPEVHLTRQLTEVEY